MVNADPSFLKVSKTVIKKRLHNVSGHSVIIVDKGLMQRIGITDEDILLESISDGGILLSPCRNKSEYLGVQ